MKAKIPEPTESIKLLESIKENWQPSNLSIELFLEKISRDIDSICEKRIKTGEIALFNYNIYIHSADYKKSLVAMSAFYDLYSHPAPLDRIVEDFRQEYKENFSNFLRDYKQNPFPVNISVLLMGSRDSITKEVDIKNPDE